MTNTCGSSVAAGANCSINVTFSPTSQGPKTGTITMNDSASSKPQVIELSGSGTVVKLAPASLTFGSQAVGTKSSPQTVQLTNTGTAALDFTKSMYIGGDDYHDFAESNNCGTEISAGASCTITVTFEPTKSGTRTANITITDNGGGSPQTVPLSGTGD